jgi:hypothetical protein
VPEKSPENYTLLTYAWVFGLSALGGFVSFIRKVKSGHARAWNFIELIGEICTSVFAGVVTFYMCEWSGFSPLATAAFVAVAGHMGTRAIFLAEDVFKSRFPAPPQEKVRK